jgi:hypothetical protein
MIIILPITIVAVIIGLCSKQMTARLWMIMTFTIIVVIGRYMMKN